MTEKKLKCWKRVNTGIKREFEQEGDKIHKIWINDKGNVLFVTDSPRGFRVGSKYLSQMDYPKSLGVKKTKTDAIKLARDYMKKRDKC